MAFFSLTGHRLLLLQHLVSLLEDTISVQELQALSRVDSVASSLTLPLMGAGSTRIECQGSAGNAQGTNVRGRCRTEIALRDHCAWATFFQKRKIQVLGMVLELLA